MKTFQKLSIAVALVLLIVSGCTVISFYPLYTDDVLVRESGLLGTWQTVEDVDIHGNNKDTLIWQIDFKNKVWEKKMNNHYDKGAHQKKNKFTYKLTIHEKSDTSRKVDFLMHMVKLDGAYYLDFFPDDNDLDITFLQLHLMGVHTFAKVEFQDTLKIHWFGSEWLEEKLNEKRIRIKHEKNSTNILLTARPKELQKFVIKYGKSPEAFEDSWSYEFVRKEK